MVAFAGADAVGDLFRFAAAGLKPDPLFTVSECATAHRNLTKKESPEPGPWRNERSPYLTEIMDCLSPSSPVRRVVFKASSQVGKSEVGNNFLFFGIAHAPGPTLVVLPTQNTMKRYVRQRVRPMLEASPVTREKVGSERGREASSSLQSIDYPGGLAMFGWASSASELASSPILYFYADEINRYPRNVDGEGSAVSLGEQRTQNFRRAKILLTSTPTVDGDSPIDDEYEASDQREFWVPCPDCGQHQVLKWGQVTWPEGQPEEAVYACEHCGCAWNDAQRWKAVRDAEANGGGWRAQKPFNGTAGFFVWAGYSLFVRLRDLAREFVRAKDAAKRGNIEPLKSFINLKLGEVWKEKADEIKPEGLAARAESWVDTAGERIEVPHGVGLLTLSGDVQSDRLEAEIRGWGAGEESWVIAHHRIYGSPTSRETWARFEAIRSRIYHHASGAPMRISVTCVDSGYETNAVYDYVASVQGQGVYAVKGEDGAKREPVAVSKRAQRAGVKLLIVGTYAMKDTLFARLKQTHLGPGYIHFRARDPDWHNGADAEYYAQFARERKIRVRKDGKMVWVWDAIGPNEAIDLGVYNLAALYHLGPNARENLGAWAEQASRWKAPVQSIGGARPAGRGRRRARSTGVV